MAKKVRIDREYAVYLRDRITHLRLESDISEYTLSHDLGYSRSYIQGITSGQSLPSMDAFFEICDYFNLTPEEFFHKDEKDSPQIRRMIKKLGTLSREDLDLAESLVDRLAKADPPKE